MARETQLIVNLTRGNVVCEEAVIADRARRRMRGLLGRRSLPPGEGMLLQPSPSIHTAFMRFPIDVVFLDRNLRVIKLVEHLPPWHTASAMEGRSTLELASGEIVRRQVQVGDQLLTVRPNVGASALTRGAAQRGGGHPRVGSHQGPARRDRPSLSISRRSPARAAWLRGLGQRADRRRR